MLRFFQGLGFILQTPPQNNMKSPCGLDRDIFGKAAQK